jgi:clan AA aspartic protease (TIGR02281 family)
MAFPKPAVAATLLVFAAACREDTGPAPEYPAGEAGTVGHAMCLLGFTAVPLREVSTGHHLVDATINGTAAAFVLDTGANVTAVGLDRAEQFGIAGGSGGLSGIVSGAGGSASQVPIDSFQIGSIGIRQDRIVTAGLGELLTALGQIAGEEIAGIIGQDVLTEHRAIIDVARPMLYLIEEDREPAPVPARQCQGQDSSRIEAERPSS